jgi:predicted nucleic acid-binding Zn ribbon protein
VYRRQDGSTFETQQRMAEDALGDCATTGQSVERVLQPFTPCYHGTGFYSTDQRESRRTTGDRLDDRPGSGATGSEIRPRRPD